MVPRVCSYCDKGRCARSGPCFDPDCACDCQRDDTEEPE